MGGKKRVKAVVAMADRVTGPEAILCATYFAVSNMGQEPQSLTPNGIQQAYNDIAFSFEYEYDEEDGPSAAGLDEERDMWFKEIQQGDTYVHGEWVKLKGKMLTGLLVRLEKLSAKSIRRKGDVKRLLRPYESAFGVKAIESLLNQ